LAECWCLVGCCWTTNSSLIDGSCQGNSTVAGVVIVSEAVAHDALGTGCSDRKNVVCSVAVADLKFARFV